MLAKVLGIAVDGMKQKGIIVPFAASWMASIAIYKWRRFDELELGVRDAA